MDAISTQEVGIYQILSGHPESWFSNRDIKAQIEGVALRTVRAHTKRFFELGLVDKVHVFPGDRFRFSKSGAAKNKDYIQQLEEAAGVLTAASGAGTGASSRRRR